MTRPEWQKKRKKMASRAGQATGRGRLWRKLGRALKTKQAPVVINQLTPSVEPAGTAPSAAIVAHTLAARTPSQVD